MKRNNHQCGRHRVRRLMRSCVWSDLSGAQHKQKAPAAQDLAILAEEDGH